ncbi:stage II sporulation protein M [Paenibacillus sp. TRM 82003]|nr:stage II sporulation protein M [Paenibacillus sp. TRM 82003]
MDLTSFLRKHKPLWNELERLVTAMSRRGARPTAEEVDRFAALHKQASGHLAFLYTHHPAHEAAVHLNKLVAKSHNVLYRDQWNSTESLRAFFRSGLVEMLRARSKFVLAAALLFAIGYLSGFVAIMTDPLSLPAIAPAFAGVDPSAVTDERENLQSSVMSAEIMTNNIRVAVLAFASGITLGLGTLYLLVYNGILIGALAAVFHRAGESYAFWAYILPHGVIELTAIFIAGGAGLYMGYVILVPGPFTRRFRFLTATKESVQLLLGTIPLFVVAGIIEGYITPTQLSLEMKYGVAALTLILLALYYVYGLKRAARPDAGETPTPPLQRVP